MLWLMNKTIIVKIIGAPIACKDGIKDSWRKVAVWVAGQLKARFGDKVKVEYFDLFNPNCPTIPPDSQLPIVLIDDMLVSSGGKISLPLICKKIEELGKTQ
jgi:disulfide oxidoreductase YuzD